MTGHQDRDSVAYVKPLDDSESYGTDIVLWEAVIHPSGLLIEGIRWKGQAEECWFSYPVARIKSVSWARATNGSIEARDA